MSVLPFMINNRVDLIDGFIAMINESPDNIGVKEVCFEEIMLKVQDNMDWLKEAKAVSVAFNDMSMLPYVKEITMFMSLAARKVILKDAEGVQWCMNEIRKITGYTPTPCIWITGKQIKKSMCCSPEAYVPPPAVWTTNF